MTEMIERVARALAEYYEDDRSERCIPQAILAIKAMREPDECMKKNATAGEIYRYTTMIDAALEGAAQ